MHQRRGPDATQSISVNGRTIIHNLLSLNGIHAPQPIFIASKGYILFYNGELYNQEVVRYYNGNDTAFLSDLLENNSRIDIALEQLDGEFTVCIYSVSDDTITIATDLFRTKPIWIGYSPQDDAWSVSSYSSGAEALTDPILCEVPENRLISINLSSSSILTNKPLVCIKEDQAETTLKQWIELFDNAILKRSPRNGRLLVPVSSGFDSGLIAYRCRFLGLEPVFLSLASCEDTEVMLRRQEQLGITFISLTQSDYLSSLDLIKSDVEDYSYSKHQPLLDINSLHEDPGAIGLYNVLKMGKSMGCKVSFSGQGADEIYSDYGFQGRPLANVSSFAGKFPDNINEILPWKNLFSGTQRAYLMKDEYIAGSLGMESRYPFLDRDLFISFLALPSHIKNATYKGPIGRWVADLNIPVASEKLGFSANRGLKKK